MSRRMKALPAALACAFVLVPKGARAQGNYHSTPNGGRSALMGNTGEALGRDGASPFMNPATIVRIHDTSFAFSMNFYSFTSTHLSAYHQSGPVDAGRFPGVAPQDTSVTDNQITVIPTTLCLFVNVSGLSGDDPEEGVADTSTRVGRQKLALCLGNVERRETLLPALNYRTTTPGGASQQAGSLTGKWFRWRFGPSYAGYITKELTIGLSLHGVYSHYGYHTDNTTVTSGGPGGGILSSVGSNGAGTAIDLDPILGVTYKLKDRYTFGASVQTPSAHVVGSFDGNLHEVYGGTALDNSVLTTGTGDFFAPTPARLSAGIGVKVASSLKVEVDGSYYFPMSSAMRSSLQGNTVTLNGVSATSTPFDATYAVRSRPTVNLGVGAEYFFSPRFSVLGGAGVDFSATPALDTTNFLGAFYKERTNRVVGSLGVGSFRNGEDFLVGTQVTYGWGDALALNPYVLPNAYSTVHLQQIGATVIFAGSTNFAAIKRALKNVEKLVKPAATPAAAPAATPSATPNPAPPN